MIVIVCIVRSILMSLLLCPRHLRYLTRTKHSHVRSIAACTRRTMSTSTRRLEGSTIPQIQTQQHRGQRAEICNPRGASPPRSPHVISRLNRRTNPPRWSISRNRACVQPRARGQGGRGDITIAQRHSCGLRILAVQQRAATQRTAVVGWRPREKDVLSLDAMRRFGSRHTRQPSAIQPQRHNPWNVCASASSVAHGPSCIWGEVTGRRRCQRVPSRARWRPI